MKPHPAKLTEWLALNDRVSAAVMMHPDKEGLLSGISTLSESFPPHTFKIEVATMGALWEVASPIAEALPDRENWSAAIIHRRSLVDVSTG